MNTSHNNKQGVVILVILTAVLIALLGLLFSRIQPIPDVSVAEGDQCTSGQPLPSGCVTCCSCGKCAGVTKTCNEVCNVGTPDPVCPSSCTPGVSRCLGNNRCTCVPDNNNAGCYEEACVNNPAACGPGTTSTTPSNPTTTTSTPTSQGSYGACGSCNTCPTDQLQQCRTDPSGACVWDPSGCGAGGGGSSSSASGGGGGTQTTTTTSASLSSTVTTTITSAGGGILPDTALISDGLGMVILGGLLLILGFSLVNHGAPYLEVAAAPEPEYQVTHVKSNTKRPKNLKEFESRFDDKDL